MIIYIYISLWSELNFSGNAFTHPIWYMYLVTVFICSWYLYCPDIDMVSILIWSRYLYGLDIYMVSIFIWSRYSYGPDIYMVTILYVNWIFKWSIMKWAFPAKPSTRITWHTAYLDSRTSSWRISLCPLNSARLPILSPFSTFIHLKSKVPSIWFTFRLIQFSSDMTLYLSHSLSSN